LIGEELAQNRETLFRIDVEGAPRVLHPISLDEACRIGEQAISNAFQHANAPHIEVTIVYGRKELRLRVRDDGCGIDPEVLAGDGRPGHWGFPGMRERAQKLRAHFDIRSRPGAGTDIELRIPASIAYVAHRPKTGATAPLTNR
jgi:signal transduction histidine kinase